MHLTIVDTKEVSRLSSATKTYREASTIDLPTASVSGDLRSSLHSSLSFSAVSVTELSDVYMNHRGVIVTQQGQVVRETLEGPLQENGICTNADGLWEIPDENIVDIDGALLATSRRGAHNYSLLLQEILPSFFLFSMGAAFSGARFCLHLPKATKPLYREKIYELLALFNIREPDVFQLQDDCVYRVKTVFVPNTGVAREARRIKRLMNPMIAEIQQSLGGDTAIADRIYVRRETSVSRSLINHEEVLDYFRVNDFQVIEPVGLTIQDQAQAFGKASVVVAEHGAALANLWYTPRDATVVELFPEPIAHRSVYRVVSQLKGLKYHTDVFPTPDGWCWNKDQVTLPVSVIDKNLKKLGIL